MRTAFMGGFLALALLILPIAASAHEHASFVIGGQTYNFVVGSLNEPIAVDDKTGVLLEVSKGKGYHTMGPDGDMDGPIVGTTPVEGLEETLKVELIAGTAKKTLDLSPAWGEEGVYDAPYYPTRATTIAYRFTGSIEGTPVDLTFTCVPEGTPEVEANEDAVKISDAVTQISRGGAFGCPAEKEGMGFPLESASVAGLKSESTKSTAGLALGAFAVILAGLALRKKQ